MKTNIEYLIESHCRQRKFDLVGVIASPITPEEYDVLVYLATRYSIDVARNEIGSLLAHEGYIANLIVYSNDNIINTRSFSLCRSGDMYVMSIYYENNGTRTDFSMVYTPKQIANIIKLVKASSLNWNNLVHDVYKKIAPERIPKAVYLRAIRDLPRVIATNVKRIALSLKER
jgi:hypothetical protein